MRQGVEITLEMVSIQLISDNACKNFFVVLQTWTNNGVCILFQGLTKVSLIPHKIAKFSQRRKIFDIADNRTVSDLLEILRYL